MDVAIAIDLDDFRRLTSVLQEQGWKQQGRREHRWLTPQGARLDLIPARPTLRRAHQLKWPISEMKMSLVGFDHVFVDAVRDAIAPDLSVKIVPLPVVALLKMVAFLDNPQDREKDVEDVAAILVRHEPEDSRRFSDEVVTTHLTYEAVGAYWIGKDLRSICEVVDQGLFLGGAGLTIFLCARWLPASIQTTRVKSGNADEGVRAGIQWSEMILLENGGSSCQDTNGREAIALRPAYPWAHIALGYGPISARYDLIVQDLSSPTRGRPTTSIQIFRNFNNC